MTTTVYTPDDHVFGRTARFIAETMDLFDAITLRIGRSFSDPHLAPLQVHKDAHDGFHSDYRNGAERLNRYRRALRRMLPGDEGDIFGKTAWAIVATYIAVKTGEPWDVEANYILEDRDDNLIRDSRLKAKYRLSSISLTEAEGFEGCLEPEFIALDSHLRDLDATTHSLAAWAASNQSMQLHCQSHRCTFRARPARTFTSAEIARFAATAADLDLKTFRSRLRCSACGESRPSIRPVPARD